MNAGFLVRRSIVRIVVAVALVITACDDDPSAPSRQELLTTVISPATIGRQESIRISFNQPVEPATALDPANFIVINQCTGLRVPGSLQLVNETELIFTPSSALPFLTPLAIRVQNILTREGQALREPFTFLVTTEAPPVTDLTWEELNSPTNDEGSGISFVDREFGYFSTTPGGLYLTRDGGASYEARFKDIDVISMRNVRAVSADSVYLTASILVGSSFNTGALMVSTDSGRTFNSAFTANPASFFSLSLRELPSTAPIALVVGGSPNLTAWRYDASTGTVDQYGGISGQFGTGGALSPDASHAAAVGFVFTSQTTAAGVAHRSTDGGRSFTPLTLPANTPLLLGAGFSDNTTALLLGDSSTVLRLDAATGAITPLTGASGIPQTEVDAATNTVTVYTFTRADFASDGQQGFVIGSLTRRSPAGDVRRGVILITRDGGQTFQRQAVQGADDNGLGFEPLNDVQVLTRGFAAVAGRNGFIAARKADTQAPAEVCSFETP